MNNRPHASRRGFTLVEILVVICIITILMSLMVVMVKGIVQRARIAKTTAIVETLTAHCESYRTDYGIYPPTHPAKGSANLHLYLGRARVVTLMRDPNTGGDIVAEKPAYIEFTKGMLMPDAPSAYPDPVPSEIIDAWGKPLHYRSPGTHNKRGVDIWSDGNSDKTEDDDVTNWKQNI